MFKEAIKKIGVSALLLVFGAVVGYLLLILAFSISIPLDVYTETRVTVNEEGLHPRESMRDGKSDYYHEKYPDILDFGTDKLIVDFSLLNPSEPLYKHALIEKYNRYWHGYVIFWRPLFKFFNLAEVRILNLGLQLLLSFFLAFNIFKATSKKRFSLAWLTIYFILNPNSMACNMQYSSIYYVTVIFANLLLMFRKKLQNKKMFLYLFLLTGMCTSYFDFLTYPMVSWAIPAGLLILIYGDTDTEKKVISALKNIADLALSAVFWIGGYLIFWAEKWIIGNMFLKADVFGLVSHEINIRSGLSDSMNILDRIKAFPVNWEHLSYAPFVVILFGWSVFWIINFVIKGFNKDSRIPAYFVMLFSAPVWYFMGAEHSIGHHLYTWRICTGTMFALLIIICLNSIKSYEKTEIKKMISRAAIIICTAATGVLLYYFIPMEDQTFWNYDYTNYSVKTELPRNTTDAFSMMFTPRFRHVTSVNPVLICDDEDGFFEISISDNNKVLYKEKVYMKDSDGTITGTSVNWFLKKGQPYVLSVSTKNLDEDATVYITDINDRPEFEGNTESMLFGYGYHTPFFDKSYSLFYCMNWFWLFMAGIYVINIFTGRKEANEKTVE